jgi:hypothetical protein
MTVATCSQCGAPRDPRAAQCRYCSAHFTDPGTGRSFVAIEEDVERALRAGRLIEAIKLYRERHKASLLDAKNAVEDMKRRLNL